MKQITLTTLVIIQSLLFAVTAQAHDPKEHMKDAQKPDCATMKNMDESKMDKNDPVMQAMMQKCKESMDHKDMKHDGMEHMDMDHKDMMHKGMDHKDMKQEDMDHKDM
ncbi:MAG: hypothetical protein RIB78_04875 [Gammaproteobacteria bacterium]